MKYFIFLFSRIRQYYQSSKAVFSIFLIGSLMLNLLIIYIYGNSVTYMMSKNINSSYYCKYTVGLNKRDYGGLRGELEQLLQDRNIKDVTFHSFIEEGEKTFFLAASQNNDAGLLWDKVKGRIYFTEAEIVNKEKCVVVPYITGPYNSQSSLKPGDILNLGILGDFEVIGVGMFSRDHYISSALFESLQLPVLSIDIVLTERLSVAEHTRFMETLSHIEGADQAIPAYGVSEDQDFSTKDMTVIFILYLFTITAFLFLLQYITVLNRKMDAVSELVGAAKGTVALFLLLERFIISLITAAGAIAFHRIFYNSIFERFNLTSIDYEWRDYCIIAIIIVLSSVLASIPFVISYARKSALRIFQE